VKTDMTALELETDVTASGPVMSQEILNQERNSTD
jgi:hypothetical protein